MLEGRRVALRAGDVDVCPGANASFLALFRAGRIESGSVTVRCPWFSEIAQEPAADLKLDLGNHLTRTGGWLG